MSSSSSMSPKKGASNNPVLMVREKNKEILKTLNKFMRDKVDSKIKIRDLDVQPGSESPNWIAHGQTDMQRRQ